MYCNACGNSIADQAHFCSHCGRATGNHSTGRLMRSRYNRKVAGVCAGLSEHVDMDASLIRILWVFLTFASGFFPGVVAYVLAWIIIPEEPALLPAAVPPYQQPVTG